MSSKLGRELERKSSRIGRNAHIAMRAERIIARRRLAMFRTQTGLMAFAGLVAGIGVLMINVGAFFWLAGQFGNATAGIILAVINFSLAIFLGLAATRMSIETEIAPVVEVRDLALEDIEAEIGEGLEEAKYLADNVRRIASDPFGAAAPSLLGPILSVLVKTLKK